MDVMFLAIFVLLVMHCIGDYSMQGKFLATEKKNSHIYMTIHCIIYTGLCAFGLFIAGMMLEINFTYFDFDCAIIAIFLSHFIIDTIKCRFNDERRYMFYCIIDQILHLSILFGVMFVLKARG